MKAESFDKKVFVKSLDPALWARNLLKSCLGNIEGGIICVTDKWGIWQTGKNKQVVVDIYVADEKFYIDLLIAGSNGAASAWRDGFWNCSNLTALFELLILNQSQMDRLEGGLATLGNLWLRLRHAQRMNTQQGSKSNISAHYDLGNDMFSLFLDNSMTYSAGIFVDESTSLYDASIEKIDRICRKLNLQADNHILEIGSGWGSFSMHAAGKYGCHVTTTTISSEQFKLAAERIKQAGLESRIELILADYRDLKGSFDHIVSIEMIEAVGHKFLPVYFHKCNELLKKNGKLAVQVITMSDNRYEKYLKSTDFIQQYIFPGSCCPSVSILTSAASGASLQIRHLEDIGLHYAKTLRLWFDNFCLNESEIRKLGFGDDFIRLWKYYFCYCEAGFKQKYIGDVQIIFDKQGSKAPNILGYI